MLPKIFSCFNPSNCSNSILRLNNQSKDVSCSEQARREQHFISFVSRWLRLVSPVRTLDGDPNTIDSHRQTDDAISRCLSNSTRRRSKKRKQWATTYIIPHFFRSFCSCNHSIWSHLFVIKVKYGMFSVFTSMLADLSNGCRTILGMFRVDEEERQKASDQTRIHFSLAVVKLVLQDKGGWSLRERILARLRILSPSALRVKLDLTWFLPCDWMSVIRLKINQAAHTSRSCFIPSEMRSPDLSVFESQEKQSGSWFLFSSLALSLNAFGDSLFPFVSK